MLPDEDFESLPDLIRTNARLRPDSIALIDSTAENALLSYLEFDELVDRIAAGLQRDGVRVGDAVAICATASIRYVALFIGALRAGAVVAPLAPSVTPASFAAMLGDAFSEQGGQQGSAQGDGLVGEQDREIGGDLGSERHGLLFIDDSAARQVLGPDHGSTMLVGPPAVRVLRIDSDEWNTWLPATGSQPKPVTIDPDSAFNIIYSSGTTGTPKGIVQPHRMRWGQINRGDFGYGPDAVTLLATPLYSNTTLVVMIPSLARGGRVVLMPKFEAGAYLALAARHRVTHAMLVPVQYQRLMARPDFDAHDLSSFRFKFSTSAPFAADLKADVLRRWPGGLIEYYGMTEGGGTCILLAHEHPDKLHTVGRPGPGSDIRLIDEAGRQLDDGRDGDRDTGEVVGHSPNMMTGYHRQPALTREAEWYDATGKRFIRTGDVGRFDADGFLVLLDRRKDMIISGGFNLYPSDLEAVLRQHPAVADVAVVGVPSVQWGETPVGFVVLRAPGTTPAELLEWANARLGRMQRISAIEIVVELPRSPIGKVLKRELRDAWSARNR